MNTVSSRLEGRRVLTIRASDCASEWGNDGLDVLSTPAIIGHMERLCVDTLSPRLDPGEMTVGTGVQMRHLGPANLGEDVTYQVTADGSGRKISMTFQVTDADGRLLSDGTHQRAVVDKAAFLTKLQEAAISRSSTP